MTEQNSWHIVRTMKTLLLLLLCLCSCATFDGGLSAMAHDPNVAKAVQTLVSAATDHLSEAIDMAENNALRLFTNGDNPAMAEDLHAATELKKVKDGLDALNPAVPEPPTRFAHPEQ